MDDIKTHQNTTNRIEMKIIKRLLDAGTIVTLPNKPGITFDSRDNKKLYINDASDKACIGTYSFTGDLNYALRYLSQVYEEARQILGITDSFQGRKDTTATSARAKEFSANMSAGRLQSKRTMKKEAYSRLFELMFKFELAYADEPRFVSYRDEKSGNVVYEEFNRYDFIEKDPTTGEWYWNDDFIFSVDTSAPLANNQEAMWQETRMNFSEGTFGDPSQIETQILFWSMMEILHYPWAGSTKKALEARKQQQQEMAAAAPGMMPGAGPEMAPPPGRPPMPDMAPQMPGGPMPQAPAMAGPTMGMPL